MDYKETFKGYYSKIKPYIEDKKYQWAITIFVLILIITLGVQIRTNNLPNLIDPTTGDYTPLALDPYYFLRMSETLIANDGVLPEVDVMRYPALNAGWSKELTPYSTLWIYNIMKAIDPNTTLNYSNVLNPVIFFALGLIVFFFLVLILSKNKLVALSALMILVVIPPYLYRTMAGFSDHESIGMFGFFLSLISFAYVLIKLKENKSPWTYGAFGLLSGILTSFAVAAWGGGGKFLFMILPLAFISSWFLTSEKNNYNWISFYGLWIFGSIFSAPLFRESAIDLVRANMLGVTGLLTFAALIYVLVETFLAKLNLLDKFFEGKFSNHLILVSSVVSLILGLAIYGAFFGNPFGLLSTVINKIIRPFGGERITLTVAENAQPYLNDLINQITKMVFYLFLLASFFVGYKLSRGIKKKSLRPLFYLSFSFFIIGILYSRISSGSILNGGSFLSRALIFISFLTFAASSIYIYKKSKWTADTRWIFVAAWMIPMLLAVRSAVRVFFAIVPFISFLAPLMIYQLFKFSKNSKENLAKVISISLVVVLTIGLVMNVYGFYKVVNSQSKGQFPSYSPEWQNSMSWVRDNTPEGSIFLHWWDYGYWVQTGGNRPSVTDGGHYSSYWDHLIGRYVLTTPYPETAKSFMKTHNVSYLLIDPTDIGKYPAYSSIGDHKDASDRNSWMPSMISDPSQIQETSNGTTRIYQGGFALDGDLLYEGTFLPSQKAGVAGVIIEKRDMGEGLINFMQPTGVYFDPKGIQVRLPIRYLFFQGDLIDFGSGVNATAYLYANVISTSSGQQFDVDGALIYLSEKNMNSLVAKLYLMDDPLNEYPELELVHSGGQYPFLFYYSGSRGPIKIWKVDITQMDNILIRDEFLPLSGGYGELDDLQFSR